MNNSHILVDRMFQALGERDRRVLIAGDAMTDKWMHGRLEPSQDGCDKFVLDRIVVVPGGAGNAHRSLQMWPVQTSIHCAMLNRQAVKTRYLVEGKIVFRADDDGPKADDDSCAWGRNLAMEMVKHSDAVLLTDYDKGFLSKDFIQSMVSLCRAREIPCVADCKRAPEVYDGCITKANHDWAKLWRRCDKGVVTRGAEPPLVNSFCDNWIWGDVDCVNHVGAGDCFAAHLTLALACGFSLKEAAVLAHSAGRVYVQHPHNRPPMPSEIAADLALATR